MKDGQNEKKEIKKEMKKESKNKENEIKKIVKKDEKKINKKKEMKNEDKKIKESNNNNINIGDFKIKEQSKNGKIEEKTEKTNSNMIENQNLPKYENNPAKIKEGKDSSKTTATLDINKLPKTLLTKKTEDNYDLMMKCFKDNYKGNFEDIKHNIINYEDFSSDKFLGLVSDKIKMDNTNKNLIDDFLQRNKDDAKQRQDNDKSINERIKLIEDSKNKKLYFNNKESQKEYFDSFYNKQIQFKNNCKEHLDKLTQKYDEEKKKYYIPEQKVKYNLDYFNNNEPVKISKYSVKAKNLNNKNNEENNLENNKDNKIQNLEPKIKKLHSFDPLENNNNYDNNKTNDIDKKDNNNDKDNINGNIENKKFKKIKSGPIFHTNEVKLSKKEIEELTNKLHYDGELLKIKKQKLQNGDFEKNRKNNSFSKEKLTRSSMIILIKTILYEYSLSIKKNTLADYSQNPKINYDQYIDILKDLYYLGTDALPEDYLENDSTYKELWNKLTMFSNGPENSIESNVFLLFLLELNGFFINEKIIKELGKEIYWIKLEEYDDLIANARYIEENWNDLKVVKSEIIKKLRAEGKYNPIHCEELYNNDSINKNLNANLVNNNTNHFITTLKGNTNYHIIHGYNSNNKNSEISLSGFSNLFNKNEDNKHDSFTISNFSNIKNLKNRQPIKDSYKDIIIKRKEDIENKKKDEEKKLKEICTFKPKINPMINKKVFSNIAKVELPKYKKNKNQNKDKILLTLENNQNSINNNNSINNIENNISNKTNNNIKEKNLTKNYNHNFLSINNTKEKNPSHSPILKNNKTKINKNELKRNKSSLQKMFETNPLKDDKKFNEKIQKLKMARNKEIENNNYLSPMRLDISFQNKFEGIGVSVIRDANIKQKTQNVIFYNIKINENIKTLKYIEGEDLKLTVINFVRKNKLPEDIIDIIFTKIKEKTIEEIL